MKGKLYAKAASIFNASSALCDAHAHIGEEKELMERKRLQIPSLICASTPLEAVRLQEIAENPAYSPFILPTYGLHPWQADKYNVSDIEPFFKMCDVIGEIGMDSVWCHVPLAIQERVFREQLLLAEQLHKPVILHTKGQEKQIADIIKDYENTYLVHWYSSMEHLEDYLALNCYYSIGPDVWWNEAVRRVAALVPLERILVETDGMGAVKWAYDMAEISKEVLPGSVCARRDSVASASEALISTMEVMAGIRGISLEAMREQVCANFERFCHAFCF